MFMGVPYIPFFMVAGGILLCAMYFDFFFLLLIPVAIFIMRQMARRDEMIFTILGLRIQFLLQTPNRRKHNGMWVYSPNLYRGKNKSETIR